MPIHTFKCNECDYKEELSVSFQDIDKPCNEVCPICGKLSITRCFPMDSNFTLRFMGSSIQNSKHVPSHVKERLHQIKQQYGKDKCRGIE